MYEYIRRDEERNIEKMKRTIGGVDVDIKKGDSMAVLGYNDSSKSTLAKHASGLLPPTKGTVWVGDMDTRDEEHIQDMCETAGMVPQNLGNQIIGNTMEEDVGSGLKNIGVLIGEIWKCMEASLKTVGMTAYRLQSPSKPSGGRKQRVAIAGIMAMKPEYIISDEPIAMLDPSGRKEVIRIIHELNRTEDITVLLTTHYMEEAIEADRIIIVNDGRIVMDGQPREIFPRVKELKNHGLDVSQVAELAWGLKEAGIPLADGTLGREELVEQLISLLRQGKGDRGYQ